MYDGSIVIGTELSTNKFDKQIADLDRKIDQEEDKKIIIETKLSNQEQELERAKQQVDELADTYQKLKAVQEKVAQRNATPQDFETLQNLQAQYGTLEKINNTLQKAMDKQDALQLKIQQTKSQYEGVNQKVAEYKQKLNTINIQKQKAEVDQLKGSIDKVGNSFTGAVKKAGKLALAIFGIRSAYMMLRRASSELATYDEQYATNLEYIRFVLTQAIAPVLKYIVNLAMQLLGYINAILQAWFGVNLFANGSVEAFQKMKKGASGVAKAVKEIKKQLLGFDEINMLTSQSDTGTQAGANGVVAMPEIDLSSIHGERPAWLEWIIENKDIILSLLTGIGTALLLIKLGLAGIKALGIGVMIAGIVYTIETLLKYLKDPSWENFGKIITGVGIIILGLGIAIGSVPAIVAGAIAIIVGLIVKNWQKIKDWLEKAESTVYGIGDKIANFFIENLGILGTGFALAVTYISGILGGLINNFKTAWNNIFTGFKNILDGIIRIFKGDFWGGLQQIAGGVIQVFTGMWQTIYGSFIAIWNAIVRTFNKGGEIFKGVTEGISEEFKTIVNRMIEGINWVISAPFNTINNMLNRIKDFSIMGQKPFAGAWNWNPIAVPQIPRLKVGGIINMPNKGTLVGGGMALGGEAGKEGVLPLTNQQAMAELGREIGKNVLVNLTNVTQMNGRVISRELKQVRSTQEFAYNM